MPGTTKAKEALEVAKQCGYFAIEIVRRWRAFVVAVFLESLAVAIYVWRGGVIPVWTYWVVGFGGLVVAAFRAWQNERREVENRDGVIAAMSEKISAIEGTEQKKIRVGLCLVRMKKLRSEVFALDPQQYQKELDSDWKHSKTEETIDFVRCELAAVYGMDKAELFTSTIGFSGSRRNEDIHAPRGALLWRRQRERIDFHINKLEGIINRSP